MGSDQVFIGAPLEEGAKAQKLEVTLNGETITLETNGEVSVLEALLDAGHNPPYSCMDGACMACMGKIEEGTVVQEDPGILTEDNIEDLEALTCQAKPCSPLVKVNYDDL